MTPLEQCDGRKGGRQPLPAGTRLNYLRDTRLTVHLGTYRRNIACLREALAPSLLMAVVKANAYGHGLARIGQAARMAGADWLGVATAEEGVALREAHDHGPVLVLGTVNPEGARACVQHGLTMTAGDAGCIRNAQQAARDMGAPALVHLKLDTGMGRIGVRTREQLTACLGALDGSPQVRLTGVFTHLADADNPDPAYTTMQLERFARMRALLSKGLPAHAAASAAALQRPDSRLDMVRIGIAGYGYPTVPTALALCPCLTWTAEVAFVKDIGPGDAVGYGRTFTAPAPMRVATLAVGYGDGYPRALSSVAQVLLHGVRCPVIGRVCMDQTMVDVTRAPRTAPGDSAVLLGSQGADAIDAEEMAGWLHTIPYEVLLLPRARVPVIYDEE